MKKRIFAVTTGIIASFAPILAFAQTTTPPLSNLNNVNGLLNSVLSILKGPIFQILMALVVLFFFWEIVMWVRAAPGEEKADRGKGVLMSIVAIFILFTLWGVISFISDSTGISGTQTPTWWTL